MYKSAIPKQNGPLKFIEKQRTINPLSHQQGGRRSRKSKEQEEIERKDEQRQQLINNILS